MKTFKTIFSIFLCAFFSAVNAQKGTIQIEIEAGLSNPVLGYSDAEFNEDNYISGLLPIEGGAANPGLMASVNLNYYISESMAISGKYGFREHSNQNSFKETLFEDYLGDDLLEYEYAGGNWISNDICVGTAFLFKSKNNKFSFDVSVLPGITLFTRTLEQEVVVYSDLSFYELTTNEISGSSFFLHSQIGVNYHIQKWNIGVFGSFRNVFNSGFIYDLESIYTSSNSIETYRSLNPQTFTLTTLDLGFKIGYSFVK
jgi:hypothetical protein